MQFSHTAMEGPSYAEERSAQAVSVRQVSKRSTAFDLGIQLDWFNEYWQAQAALWQDVSNTYQGQHAEPARPSRHHDHRVVEQSA